jgi:hypothetical protein
MSEVSGKMREKRLNLNLQQNGKCYGKSEINAERRT